MAGRYPSFSTMPTGLSRPFLDPTAARDHHRNVLTEHKMGWLPSKAGVRAARRPPPPLPVWTWVLLCGWAQHLQKQRKTAVAGGPVGWKQTDVLVSLLAWLGRGQLSMNTDSIWGPA